MANWNDLFGSGSSRLTSIVERTGNTQSSLGEAISSLAAGQALQTVLDIPSHVSISAIAIQGSGAQTVDKVKITTERGVLFDGPIILGSATDRAYLVGYSQVWADGGGAVTGGISITPQYVADFIKIELDTTSSVTTITVTGIIDNIL
jgi:hypothetical protein